jgi:hypothetical protein
MRRAIRRRQKTAEHGAAVGIEGVLDRAPIDAAERLLQIGGARQHSLPQAKKHRCDPSRAGAGRRSVSCGARAKKGATRRIPGTWRLFFHSAAG